MSFDSIDPSSLIPINMKEVSGLSPLPADFYVRLSEGSYILVGRRGEPRLQDLHALKNKDSVFELYVRRDEYKNCIGASLQIAEVAITSKEISDLKKVDFLFQCSDGVMNEIYELGCSHESMEHAKVVSQAVITLISAKDDLNSVLALLNEQSNEVVKHSMAVSAVSTVIAWHMNWTVSSTIQKLALGALLHDIGLKELPSELISKPRHLMSLQDIKAYEAHVMRGVEILSTMPSVPNEVIGIAMEHHENAIGQGYPRHNHF
jgi:putative nucleotidyltransferase with HDIG domain